MECTGAGTRCGSCQPTIEQLVGDAEVVSAHRRLAIAPVSSAA
jgi:NAD(P)H-nitrite reductase large subunit